MSSYDIERSKQESAEIRKVFREIFPLAPENSLPWAPCHIKGFLRERIEQEVAEGCFHYQSQIARILCEVTPPKTHVVDMVREVVELAKIATADRSKVEKAVETTAERDEMLDRLREIGRIVGCNHTEDADGRAKLVRCVRETIEAAKS